MAHMERSYSVATFNLLPGLRDAKNAFDEKKGLDAVNELGDIIVKHDLSGTFGIGLAHRHFELLTDEKLVEFNGTSTPWLRPDVSDIGGKIVPQTWLIGSESIVPYEFYLSPLGRDPDIDFSGHERFLIEIMDAVDRLGLSGMLTLRLFPHDGYEGALEVTEGRACINLGPDEVPKAVFEDSTDTIWFFDPKWINKKWACKCIEVGPGCHFHIHGH